MATVRASRDTAGCADCVILAPSQLNCAIEMGGKKYAVSRYSIDEGGRQ